MGSKESVWVRSYTTTWTRQHARHFFALLLLRPLFSFALSLYCLVLCCVVLCCVVFFLMLLCVVLSCHGVVLSFLSILDVSCSVVSCLALSYFVLWKRERERWWWWWCNRTTHTVEKHTRQAATSHSKTLRLLENRKRGSHDQDKRRSGGSEEVINSKSIFCFWLFGLIGYLRIFDWSTIQK